jgi:hypothetical protein
LLKDPMEKTFAEHLAQQVPVSTLVLARMML